MDDLLDALSATTEMTMAHSVKQKHCSALVLVAWNPPLEMTSQTSAHFVVVVPRHLTYHRLKNRLKGKEHVCRHRPPHLV